MRTAACPDANCRPAAAHRAAPGAVFEQKYRPEDRFASIGEYCQAIREEGRPSSRPNRKELLAKLENVRQFQNSFGSEEAASGGFLIPEIMRSEVLQLALEQSTVRAPPALLPPPREPPLPGELEWVSRPRLDLPQAGSRPGHEEPWVSHGPDH